MLSLDLDTFERLRQASPPVKAMLSRSIGSYSALLSESIVVPPQLSVTLADLKKKRALGTGTFGKARRLGTRLLLYHGRCSNLPPHVRHAAAPVPPSRASLALNPP